MRVGEIEREIERPETTAKTNYENCEKLVMLKKALKCMNEDERGEESGTTVDCMESERCLTCEEAESWVSNMKNADGSAGAHWALEKTEQIRTQRGIDCDPIEFWVSMNMMYSDYYKVAKKNNVSTVDFYADMAKAFLDDADALPGKLERYQKYVVSR